MAGAAAGPEPVSGGGPDTLESAEHCRERRACCRAIC